MCWTWRAQGQTPPEEEMSPTPPEEEACQTPPEEEACQAPPQIREAGLQGCCHQLGSGFKKLHEIG